MRFHRTLLTSLSFLSTFLVFTSAKPAPGGDWHGPGKEDCDCLTDADAKVLVDVIVSLGVGFDPAYVSQYLADDFTAQSDSVNFFFGLPPGFITGPSKALWIEGAYNFTTQTPQAPTTVVAMFHSCTEIAYKWINEETPYPVQGIEYLTATKKAGHWQVLIDWSEFNVGADGADAGLWPYPKPPTAG